MIGVALLVALENVFPPIPSELILLLAGFNVSEGRFDYVSGVIAATIGSVIGAYFLYGVGRLLDDERMERFLAGVGRFVGLKKSDVHKGFVWFERHGSCEDCWTASRDCESQIERCKEACAKGHWASVVTVHFSGFTRTISTIFALWLARLWQVGE